MKKIIVFALVLAVMAPAVFAQQKNTTLRKLTPQEKQRAQLDLKRNQALVEKIEAAVVHGEYYLRLDKANEKIATEPLLSLSADEKKALEKHTDTLRLLLDAKASKQDLQAAMGVLASLDNIRDVFGAAREEKTSQRLQAFLGLYEKLAAGFASNTNTDESFVTSKPELVNILAREIQKPIQVGWAEDTAIVVGTYIVDHQAEIDQPWINELTTFNRDVLLRAKN